MTVLVTGGSGFIGSHLVRLLIGEGERVINLDKLTYAGNPENLRDVENDARYRFARGDIADIAVVAPLVAEADLVINVAAETHVDRSIDDADAFLRTNVLGVNVLCRAILEAAREIRFVQVSTDEVYGSIEQGAFREEDRFSPSSPYAAAKASGELIAFSYAKTHGLDVVATRGANTYGPYQFPEKLIPFAATEAIDGRPIPVYGDGLQCRDWLHVDDHARAIWFVTKNGKSGEAYNVPGENERNNLEVVRMISGEIEHVADRPGHDRRYAVDGAKLRALGFRAEKSFESGLRETLDWYRTNTAWWRGQKDKSRNFFARHYASLGASSYKKP